MVKNIFDVINSSFVGFDKLLNEIQTFTDDGYNNNYPPYNLIKSDDHKYQLEFALAGWNIDDLNVYESGGTLYVQSNNWSEQYRKPGSFDNWSEYPKTLHHGISKKRFQSRFKLSKLAKVDDVTMDNGLLIITISEEIPTPTEPVKTNQFKIKKK